MVGVDNGNIGFSSLIGILFPLILNDTKDLNHRMGQVILLSYLTHQQFFPWKLSLSFRHFE